MQQSFLPARVKRDTTHKILREEAAFLACGLSRARENKGPGHIHVYGWEGSVATGQALASHKPPSRGSLTIQRGVVVPVPGFHDEGE